MPLGNALAILKSLANSKKGRMVENFLDINVKDMVYYNNFFYFIEGRNIKKTDLNKNIIDVVIDPKFNNVELSPTSLCVDESENIYFGDGIQASSISEEKKITKVDKSGNITQPFNTSTSSLVFYNKKLFYASVGFTGGSQIIYEKDFISYFDKTPVNNLNAINDFAFNSKGDIYVANTFFSSNQKNNFSRIDIATKKTDGSYTTKTEYFQQTERIEAICLDKDDNLFFFAANTIYKVDTTKKFEVLAGKYKQSGDVVGYWENARFNTINKLVYVNTGGREILYIATNSNGIKRMIL